MQSSSPLGASDSLAQPLLAAESPSPEATQIPSVLEDVAIVVSDLIAQIPDVPNPEAAAPIDHLADLKEAVQNRWMQEVEAARDVIAWNEIPTQAMRANLERFFADATQDSRCGDGLYDYVVSVGGKLPQTIQSVRCVFQCLKAAAMLGSGLAFQELDKIAEKSSSELVYLHVAQVYAHLKISSVAMAMGAFHLKNHEAEQAIHWYGIAAQQEQNPKAIEKLTHLFTKHQFVFQRMLLSLDPKQTNIVETALRALKGSDPDLDLQLIDFRASLVRTALANECEFRQESRAFVEHQIAELTESIHHGSDRNREQAFSHLIRLLPLSTFAQKKEHDAISHALMTVMKVGDGVLREKVFKILSRWLNFFTGEEGRIANGLLHLLAYSIQHLLEDRPSSVPLSADGAHPPIPWIPAYSKSVNDLFLNNRSAIRDRLRASDRIPIEDQEAGVNASIDFLDAISKTASKDLIETAVDEWASSIEVSAEQQGIYWQEKSPDDHAQTLALTALEHFAKIIRYPINDEHILWIWLPKFVRIFNSASSLIRKAILAQLGVTLNVSSHLRNAVLIREWERIYRLGLESSHEQEIDAAAESVSSDLIESFKQESTHWIRHLSTSGGTHTMHFQSSLNVIELCWSHPMVDEAERLKVKAEFQQLFEDPHLPAKQRALIGFALIFLSDRANSHAIELVNQLVQEDVLKEWITGLSEGNSVEHEAFKSGVEALWQLWSCPQVDVSVKAQIRSAFVKLFAELAEAQTAAGSEGAKAFLSRKQLIIAHGLVSIMIKGNADASAFVKELIQAGEAGAVETSLLQQVFEKHQPFLPLPSTGSQEEVLLIKKEALAFLVQHIDWIEWLLCGNHHDSLTAAIEFLATVLIESNNLYPDNKEELKVRYDQVMLIFEKAKHKFELQSHQHPLIRQKVNRITEKMVFLKRELSKVLPQLTANSVPPTGLGQGLMNRAVEVANSVGGAAASMIGSMANIRTSV